MAAPLQGGQTLAAALPGFSVGGWRGRWPPAASEAPALPGGAAGHHAGYPRACLGCGAAAGRDLLGQLIKVQRLELCERARHVLVGSREQRGVSSMFKMPIHTLLRFRNPGESITHVYAKSGQLVQYDASQRDLSCQSGAWLELSAFCHWGRA